VASDLSSNFVGGRGIAQVQEGGAVEAAPFTSTLLGCESGVSDTIRAAGSPVYPPNGVAHRVIDSDSQCDGGEGGFVVRMIATFGPGHGEPSTAHWRVTSSWGTMAGLHAQWTLEGYGVDCPGFELCVNDLYSGRYHFAP
jgi:hypothetical protein